jgi:putative polyketide hydroxylase
LAGADGDEWCEIALRVSSSVGVDLVAYRAGPGGDLVSPKGKWESSAWISSNGALLIRPDGFIAWRSWGQPLDLQEKLTEVLMQALCRGK